MTVSDLVAELQTIDGDLIVKVWDCFDDEETDQIDLSTDFDEKTLSIVSAGST